MDRKCTMKTRSEADDDELPTLSHTPSRFSARSHLYGQSVARTSPYFLGCTPGVRSRRHLPRPTSAQRQPDSSSSMSQWTPGPPSTYPHSSAPPRLGGRSRREVALKEAAGGGRGEKNKGAPKQNNPAGGARGYGSNTAKKKVATTRRTVSVTSRAAGQAGKKYSTQQDEAAAQKRQVRAARALDQTTNQKSSLSAINEGNIPSRKESVGQQHWTSTDGAERKESDCCGPPPPGERSLMTVRTSGPGRLSVSAPSPPPAASKRVVDHERSRQDQQPA